MWPLVPYYGVMIATAPALFASRSTSARLGIPSRILTLSVRLVLGLTLDHRSGGTRTPVVIVHVINEHDDAAADRQTLRRAEAMRRRGSVHPDNAPTDRDFAVDDASLPVALEDPGLEPERADQEGVHPRDVLVDEKRDDVLRFTHFRDHLRSRGYLAGAVIAPSLRLRNSRLTRSFGSWSTRNV